MKILQEFVLGKLGDPELCEDVVVVTPDFVAVIDGTTDRTGWKYDGKFGGRAAADACADALAALPANARVNDAISAMNDRFGSFRIEHAPTDGPSAAVVVYSVARRELWRIGDVAYWWTGMAHREFTKAIDLASSRLRAATLQTYLNGGASVEELLASDPGAEVIQPFLDRQYLLRNATSEWSYGAIDGTEVPRRHIEVVAVPADATEVVIASDGYPSVAPTLAEAESQLERLIKLDPLCMRELIGPKSVQPGAVSFDDRAYVRFAI
jgi:hypothetical protein